jgi:hypothetical protein
MQYKGGTYIAQASGDLATDLLAKWLASISDQQLAEWKLSRQGLAAVIVDDSLVPIDGCIGVWCITGLVKNALVLINVIATDQSTDVQPHAADHL